MSSRLALALALVLVALAVPGPTAAQQGKLPTRKQWLSDVRQAMKGSQPYVSERVAQAESQVPAPMLAINFDIDNTVIATEYDDGGPIKRMLKFAKYADQRGVALLFNSARIKSKRAATLKELAEAGYPVEQLCLRSKTEKAPESKQRCRQQFVDDGYTIIANVGNRSTDFEGGNYDRAFKLPNYNNKLA